MALTVNTNMQALRIQTNLNSATVKMNTAMERMSSGSRINSAKDDAAGLGVSTTLQTTIGASKIASQNVAIGSDLLSVAEGTLKVVTQNLQRVRDLVEQAANGTYSTANRTAILGEIDARLTQAANLGTNTKFNGTALLAGSDIVLQTGTDATGKLSIDGTSGATAALASIGTAIGTTLKTSIDQAFSVGTSASIADTLSVIDTQISNMTTKQTAIGALQNQLGAIADGLSVQQTNLTSALSTIKDADVASESASYVQNQILQQASASLLVQANSAPQIALTLIKGG